MDKILIYIEIRMIFLLRYPPTILKSISRSDELVTNLPPESKEKWAQYSKAYTIEEKLVALKEFYSSIPKHKGTSRLRADVRRKISILRRQIDEKKTRKGGKGRSWFVEKQGAAQIVLLGLANSGKSTLLSRITNVKPLVSSVPHFTMEPRVGVFFYTDISFQIIDTPSIHVGVARGAGLGPQILGLARNADGIIIVLDLSSDPVEQLDVVRRELDEFGIQIVPSEAQIEFIGVSDDSQVKVSGKLLNCTEEDVRRLLDSYGIRAGLIKIGGGATLEQIEDTILRNTVYRPTVIVANKFDVKNSSLNLERLLTIVKGEIEILPVSCFQDELHDKLGEYLVSVLDIVRVYTKNPNSSTPSSIPITVKKGTKVLQVARMIHSRLSRDFRYARIWGRSAKYDGQRVGENHTLADGDTLEIHCK